MRNAATVSNYQMCKMRSVFIKSKHAARLSPVMADADWLHITEGHIHGLPGTNSSTSKASFFSRPHEMQKNIMFYQIPLGTMQINYYAWSNIHICINGKNCLYGTSRIRIIYSRCKTLRYSRTFDNTTITTAGQIMFFTYLQLVISLIWISSWNNLRQWHHCFKKIRRNHQHELVIDTAILFSKVNIHH